MQLGRVGGWQLAVAGAALAAVSVALWRLASATSGLVIEKVRVGEVPATVYRPEQSRQAPAVVIAHGFAGSQQLMQPFAATLARNGYVSLTFDFPGHGQNATPLPGGLRDERARGGALQHALDAVVQYARTQPWNDGRLALLGHSMGSDAVARYAQTRPEIAATVGVSLFYGESTPDRPRNLLAIDGAWENKQLLDASRAAVALASGGPVTPGVTYGSFAQGTARRLALAPRSEHIGVLYSRTSLAEAVGWLDATFGRRSPNRLDHRGPWLGLLYAGLVSLAWPLSKLLPRVTREPTGAGLGWRGVVPLALAPALLTPLVLWKLPTSFLPILLGDYLLLHFALYGTLTGLGLWLAQRQVPSRTSLAHTLSPQLVLAALATAAYSLIALGLPLQQYVLNYLPTGQRLPLVGALFAGMLPYFLADEWLTRGTHAPKGAYWLSKALFLCSLVGAIALNLNQLFFLIIIVPAILAYFLIYGLLSGWAYRATGHPWVGALANALVFAWATAVSFPVVG
jgi:dienelactone hydrolase